MEKMHSRKETESLLRFFIYFCLKMTLWRILTHFLKLIFSITEHKIRLRMMNNLLEYKWKKSLIRTI